MPFPVNNIKDVCKERGITLAELEREIGVGNGIIAKWEFAPRTPQIGLVLKIAECLDVPLTRIVYGDEKAAAPEGDGNADDVILRFLRSLPKERLRGILLALEAPEEVLAALDREEPRG